MFAVLHVADRASRVSAHRAAPSPDLAPWRAGKWLEVDAQASRIRRAGGALAEYEGGQDVVVEALRQGRASYTSHAGSLACPRGIGFYALSWLVVPPSNCARA